MFCTSEPVAITAKNKKSQFGFKREKAEQPWFADHKIISSKWVIDIQG